MDYPARRLLRRFLPLVLLGVLAPVSAATITVIVPGPLDGKGTVGCGLYSGERGFPMEEKTTAQKQWLPARTDGVTCEFRDVADGTYAVSVVVDTNGNHLVDTNPMGMPTEAWGVSNNVRPAMRAPRFNEAAFSVTAGQPVKLDVRVRR